MSKYEHSKTYRDADTPDAYAANVSPSDAANDALASLEIWSEDKKNLGQCAHAPLALLVRALQADAKLMAANGKHNLIALLQRQHMEIVSNIHAAREGVHNTLHHQ